MLKSVALTQRVEDSVRTLAQGITVSFLLNSLQNKTKICVINGSLCCYHKF